MFSKYAYLLVSNMCMWCIYTYILHHTTMSAYMSTIVCWWQGRDFTIVFRSFGDDISEVVEEMNAFATGQHPSYPEVRSHS